MIVDDKPVNCDVFVRQIRDWGGEATAYERPGEALVRISEARPIAGGSPVQQAESGAPGQRVQHRLDVVCSAEPHYNLDILGSLTSRSSHANP